jgi:regulator of nucleoside diphosphate kinase
MARRRIIISRDDCQRLQSLLNSKATRFLSESDRLDDLQTELNRARVVSTNEVPKDVVTMNSTVTILDLDTNQSETYTLVYPELADIANDRLSVLAPIGTAILGYRVGDRFRWRVPVGWRKLQIDRVVRQPEPAGHLALIPG